jgi:hypothetical protein
VRHERLAVPVAVPACFPAWVGHYEEQTGLAEERACPQALEERYELLGGFPETRACRSACRPAEGEHYGEQADLMAVPACLLASEGGLSEPEPYPVMALACVLAWVEHPAVHADVAEGLACPLA